MSVHFHSYLGGGGSSCGVLRADLGNGDLFYRLDLLSSSFGELAILDPERGIVVALTAMHA
jgi:hypothetical protein